MSSKRRLARKQRRKSCAGKIRHETRERAQAHVASLRRKDNDRMSVYRCSECSFWHCGHAPYQGGGQ